MTVSLWQRQSTGMTEQCECLVIGAGICGISAALHLERRGIDTIVLERGRLAGVDSGASARNAGFLMRGAAENYASAARTWGRDRARLLWMWTEENLAGLREEGIDATPGYAARPSCLLALEEPEYQELLESVALLQADGFDVEWIDQGEDDAWRCLHPLGGLLNPGDSVCDPVQILRHFAAKLSRPVLDEHEVLDIRGHSSGLIRVQTPRATFLAPRVLVCTNAYVPLLLPSLADDVRPCRGQLMAVRRPGARLDYAYYANQGYEYFRQIDSETMIFGGCRRSFADTEVGYEDRPTPEVQVAIEDFASRTLGVPRGNLEIIARWTGIMGFTSDGLPLVGPVDGDWPPGAVMFCGGFTGHGMSLAHRVSRSAVDEMFSGVPCPFSLSRVKRAGTRTTPSPTPLG
jgi:glycine/D-amino acid oxidase-like deaminating enzyme